MEELRRLDGYDELKAIIDASDEEALERFGAPTLVRLPGTWPGRARFVSCLLHGNEDSGYRAVLDLLRAGPELPYDLWVFVGNVAAATTDGWFAHRYLDGQEDLNRVWGLPPDTPQRRVAADVLDALRDVPLEAALDIHNTTGHNPSHAIVPAGSRYGDVVAAACSDLVLHWRLRAHSLMEALTPWCPAIALESGISGSPRSADTARRVLARFLALDDPSAATPLSHVRVVTMHARVVVRDEVGFAFGHMTDDIDLALGPDLDRSNFDRLPAGTRIGSTTWGRVPLEARDMYGKDVTDRYFAVADGTVVLREPVVPVMMTRTVTQTRRDCLFYVAQDGG